MKTGNAAISTSEGDEIKNFLEYVFTLVLAAVPVVADTVNFAAIADIYTRGDVGSGNDGTSNNATVAGNLRSLFS